MALAIPLLASCGVPRLYAPPKLEARVDPAKLPSAKTMAPKVADIVDEIACELGAAGVNQLHNTPYSVLVFLTLEVDDNLDLTPSVSLINPLAVTGEVETNTLSADLGGARKRTFTTSYYLDTTKLPTVCASNRNEKKLYKLSGSLDLFEIARDGAGVLDKGSIQKPQDPKLVSTFGSTVQFTITRQLSSLGPLWTLKRFKGPSGSNGLINGKRLSVDSVVFTFTPRPVPPPTARQIEADADVAKKGERARAASASAMKAAERLNGATAFRIRLEGQILDAKRNGGRMSLLTLSRSVTLAANAEENAKKDLASATEDRDKSESALRDAEVERRVANALAIEQDNEAARIAGQTLLTSILLQNATLQSR